jgi:hypothetical protein
MNYYLIYFVSGKNSVDDFKRIAKELGESFSYRDQRDG